MAGQKAMDIRAERIPASLAPITVETGCGGLHRSPVARMNQMNILADHSNNAAEFMAHSRADRDNGNVRVAMNIRTTYAAIFNLH